MTNVNPNTNTNESNETTQAPSEYVYRGEGGKEFKLPVEFKEEMNKRLSIERMKVQKDYDAKFQELISEKEKLSQEFLEVKKSLMSEKEKQEYERQQKEQEYLRIQTQAEENWKLYSNTITSKALYDSISKHDVWNPKQVELLLKTAAQAEVDKTGNVTFNIDGKKYSSDELVESFLADPLNANLLKTKISSGGGTTIRNSGNQVSSNTIKREEFMQLPVEEQIKLSKEKIKVID